MDTFVEATAKVTETVSEQPAQLFADDVLLQAKNAKGMQKLLIIATKWADENSMRWNTKPGKSEALKYIRIFKSLILPKWEYAIHVTPITKRFLSAVEAAEGLFYRYVFVKYAENRRERMRVLCRLASPEMTRAYQAGRFALSLTKRKKYLEHTEEYRGREEDLADVSKDTGYLRNEETLKEALKQAQEGKVPKKWCVEATVKAWAVVEEGRPVKIPTENPNKLPGVLHITDRTTRLRCLRVISDRAPLWRKSILGPHFGTSALIELVALHRILRSTTMEKETEYECKRLTRALTGREARIYDVLRA